MKRRATQRIRPVGRAGAAMIVAAAGVIVIAAGCGPTEGEKFRDLVKQINRLKVEKIELEERLGQRDAKLASLEAQLRNLREQGAIPPEPVFDVEKITILDITSGCDTDGVDGDDVVSVYFRPVDRDGDVLKRGGEIRIKLLDNTTLGRPELLGLRVDNDSQHLRAAWYGKFWTDYYKIDVPFTPGVSLAPGQEIDIHVTFLDWTTGREYTARKAIRINRIQPDDASAAATP